MNICKEKRLTVTLVLLFAILAGGAAVMLWPSQGPSQDIIFSVKRENMKKTIMSDISFGDSYQEVVSYLDSRNMDHSRLYDIHSDGSKYTVHIDVPGEDPPTPIQTLSYMLDLPYGRDDTPDDIIITFDSEKKVISIR